jgi:cysteinyl-tRNA synthetase
MTIRLYNTATRRKEDFIPLEENKVGLYVCGVTVYDLCHIGHARSTIVFDVLTRYLKARGFDVTHVRNFTDIDDKIIERARQLEKAPEDLAREFIDAFYEDMGALGVQNADVEPKATEHIDHMIEMIKTLIDKGFAYVKEGDVFYSIEKFDDYGALSGRRPKDMRAGSRVAVDERKRDPMDFVLWKEAKPGEPQWTSPWGPGRPGWHLECSVMSNHYLGPVFDIHGGGEDLVFPHHENERAQSVAANDAPFARYWMHNGFVTVESEKMSKSSGNFLTIRDALKSYHPQVLRLFLLSKHYRSPLDFSKKDVLALQTGLVRIYRTLERMEKVVGPYPKESVANTGILSDRQDVPFLREFIQFMDDDLNTAGALGLMFEKVKELNKLMDSHGDNPSKDIRRRLEEERYHLLSAARVLGSLEENPGDFFTKLSTYTETVDGDEVERLIEDRATARAEKDWARADAIRERLDEMGIILEDGPQGTTWRVKVNPKT